jgi:hypothetical protein
MMSITSLIWRKRGTTQNYHFSGEAILLLYIFIRVFKIEESETANTYVGKKGHTAHLIFQLLVCM